MIVRGPVPRRIKFRIDGNPTNLNQFRRRPPISQFSANTLIRNQVQGNSWLYPNRLSLEICDHANDGREREVFFTCNRSQLTSTHLARDDHVRPDALDHLKNARTTKPKHPVRSGAFMLILEPRVI